MKSTTSVSELSSQPEVLKQIRTARLELQQAWFTGVILTKGAWAHEDLEIEVDPAPARTIEIVAENLGITVSRYQTTNALS